LLPDAAVNPGGSGMPEDLGFETGGELRSMTHCGGGGGGDAISAFFVSWILNRDVDKSIRCWTFADGSPGRGCVASRFGAGPLASRAP
jgi:hypothetical protein